MIELFGWLRQAATLGQNCPQMTQRPGIVHFNIFSKNCSFRHCLLKILEEDVKALRISHAFAARVNRTSIPDYYDIVKDPVSIDDIHNSVLYGEYKNKGDFLSDFQKMYKNSVAYNGKNDQLSKDALTIFNVVKASLKKYQQYVID